MHARYHRRRVLTLIFAALLAGTSRRGFCCRAGEAAVAAIPRPARSRLSPNSPAESAGVRRNN